MMKSKRLWPYLTWVIFRCYIDEMVYLVPDGMSPTLRQKADMEDNVTRPALEMPILG
jgi:hypothetical protein